MLPKEKVKYSTVVSVRWSGTGRIIRSDRFDRFEGNRSDPL